MLKGLAFFAVEVLRRVEDAACNCQLRLAAISNQGFLSFRGMSTKIFAQYVKLKQARKTSPFATKVTVDKLQSRIICVAAE